MATEPLRFLDPGGDRLEVVVRVEADGGWTPGPCASIDVGNQVELTLAELEWLVRDAGPVAIDRLRALHEGASTFQAGGRHDAAADSPSAAAAPITGEPPLPRSSSSAAGQDGPSDPSRPEPAESSPDAEEA